MHPSSDSHEIAMALPVVDKETDFAGATSDTKLAKPKAIYLTDTTTFATVYGPTERENIEHLLDIEPVPISKVALQNNLGLLRDIEIIMTTWGAPVMGEVFLSAAPKLKAVFYAAGSVRPFATPSLWARQITVSSAYAANALPVAEYALGVILLSLKRFWSFTRSVRAEVDPWDNHNRIVPGAYQSTIGLLSCGMIARRLISLLMPFNVRCLVYDPFVTDKEMADLGVELCSLKEIFERSDVVSIHTPLLTETKGLVTGQLLDSMKEGATLVNTARAGLIRQDELTEVLSRRHDLTAILDVVDPEPPSPGLPLLRLPNAWVTPHIAGSLGPECRRLGHVMLEELRRYLAGEPLRWQITEEFAKKLA